MSAGPAYPIGKRVFALWGNDGGRSDCFWAESNGVFNPCAGLKPSHRWSFLASAVLYWFQESDMVYWRSASPEIIDGTYCLCPLWDYKCRRGLSNDICLFSTPIPTSTFIRVVLCNHGMACHDMTWSLPSIRWKWEACSSHLRCRQRATHMWVAMRAASLVVTVSGENNCLWQCLEDLL